MTDAIENPAGISYNTNPQAVRHIGTARAVAQIRAKGGCAAFTFVVFQQLRPAPPQGSGQQRSEAKSSAFSDMFASLNVADPKFVKQLVDGGPGESSDVDKIGGLCASTTICSRSKLVTIITIIINITVPIAMLSICIFIE
ncbi:unnamed protein product [Calypogeia fissa]